MGTHYRQTPWIWRNTDGEQQFELYRNTRLWFRLAVPSDGHDAPGMSVDAVDAAFSAFAHGYLLCITSHVLFTRSV